MTRIATFFLTVAITILFATSVSAQSTKWSAEHQWIHSDAGHWSNQLSVGFDQSLKDSSFGISGFALAKKTWGQIYIGPSYTLKLDGVTFNAMIGAGYETGKGGGTRYGGKVKIYSNQTFFIFIREQGSSGYWHKSILSQKVSDHLRLGAFYQSNMGVGPLVEIPLGPAKVWGNMLFDHGKKNAMLGITTTF